MKSQVTLSEAPTTGLGRLIMDNHFFVPTHQRDYKWDVDRVEEFFEDLDGAMERQDRFYFIGLMVFMRSEDGRLRVLDGQQRLATTIILLSAIRSWFASNYPGGDISVDIQRDFIGRKELGGDKPIPRLTLNFNNDDRLQRYVVSGSPLAEIRREHINTNRNAPNHPLLSAILFMHDKVSSVATKHADTEKTKSYLVNLAKYIRDNVIVVRLTVPDEANAFRVFETLNDRSLDLSAVDLLKNHLFGLAYEHSADMLSHVEKRWSQITRTLTDFKEEEFLKMFWTSRYGRTQLDDIFDDFKKKAIIYFPTPESCTH